MKHHWLGSLIMVSLLLQAEMGNNSTTLATYADHVTEYIQGTPQEVSGMTKQWLDTIMSRITPSDRIFELGSAFGRDAAYFQSKGYRVECTDAVPEFVSLLLSSGFNARLCNALTDDFGNGYGLVFANAVFLHFSPEELELVLSKVHSCLVSEGLLAFSVKAGEGHEWSEEKVGAPRYFQYWQEQPLIQIVEKNRFIVDSIQHDGKWLFVIAKKNSL